MYTKQEAAKQKQLFWTTFGQYMHPVLSADGAKVNWVNYKTGVKGIQFRMDVTDTHATIALVLSHSDETLRHAQYGHLVQLKGLLQDSLGEDWQWQQEIGDEHGRITSQVGTELQQVNINRNEDWPRIISFLKPRIIALDAFWSMVRYAFE